MQLNVCANAILVDVQGDPCTQLTKSSSAGAVHEPASNLHIPRPGSPGELALCEQLRKLGCIIRICRQQGQVHCLQASNASGPHFNLEQEPYLLQQLASDNSHTHIALPGKLQRAAQTPAWPGCQAGEIELHSSGTCNGAGAQAVADGQGDVVGSTDVQDVIPVRVGKVLRVVQQAQLRMRTDLSCMLLWLGGCTTQHQSSRVLHSKDAALPGGVHAQAANR